MWKGQQMSECQNDQMSNDSNLRVNQPTKPFELAERTALFGESVIRVVRSIHCDATSRPIVSQLVRSATSIGANYLEADDAGSRKEFHYRISLCRRESRETGYWLRMLVAAIPSMRESARTLWTEANELNRIFAAINRHRDRPSHE
jgi:four helix bundle protein